jgi:hypothetical protein
MKYLLKFNIEDFGLWFGGGTHLHPHYIIKFGPRRNQVAKSYKSIIVLFNNNLDAATRKKVEMFVEHLKNGLEERRIFPGFNAIYGTNIDIEQVAFDHSGYDNPEKIFEAFNSACSDVTKCFPVIILPRVHRSLYDSMYYRTKAEFLKQGTTSQVFTIDLLNDKKNYRWSLLPTSIQIFTKMGGVPYILERGIVDSPDIQVFIMGLGISYHPLYKEQRVGYALIFDESGDWQFLEAGSITSEDMESGKDVDTLAEKIAGLLNTAITKLANKIQAGRAVLIIHYSGKEISSREENAIARALQELKLSRKILAVYVLKIKKSDIAINDLDSPSKINGSETSYPEIGTVFKLKTDVYILVTTGYFMVNREVKSNIWRGLPSSLLISRHKEMEKINEEITEINDEILLASVFGLCRLNYTSVQNPVSTEPITTRYSREIAWLTLRLQEATKSKSEFATAFRTRMWFI